MNVIKAKMLTSGTRVWIDYHGTPGHTGHINCPGVVEGTYSLSTPKKNIHGVEYISVSVRYNRINRSVFPSHCLSLL